MDDDDNVNDDDDSAWIVVVVVVVVIIIGVVVLSSLETTVSGSRPRLIVGEDEDGRRPIIPGKMRRVRRVLL